MVDCAKVTIERIINYKSVCEVRAVGTCLFVDLVCTIEVSIFIDYIIHGAVLLLIVYIIMYNLILQSSREKSSILFYNKGTNLEFILSPHSHKKRS